jgi:hypothetical protein
MSNDHQYPVDRPSAFDTDAETTDAVRRLAESTGDELAACEEFDVNSMFELLAQPGRRYVLTYLLQSEGFVTCSELVDHVVDATEHSMTDNEFRDRVTAELTHSDLPKLDSAGFVDYNMTRQIVAPTEKTALVRPYIRLALAQQDISQRLRD